MARARVNKTEDAAPAPAKARLVTLSKAEETAFYGRSTADIQSNAFEVEDEFHNVYIGAANDKGVIEPPYHFRILDRLSQENNALSPCIEAMVTNIDGTGFDFEKKGKKTEDAAEDAKIEELREFFAETWPGQSFVTQRKDIRRDIERIGNGYLEGIRNLQGEVLFFRPVDGKTMRLVKLDEAVSVPTTVKRRGADVTLRLMRRERRYVQKMDGKAMTWFREFGSSRHLHKRTGEWETRANPVPIEMRATEIIHFKALPDAHTPYGVPRWLGQMPSVLGSREAEEFNLAFFRNGGVPPVLILLQGSVLAGETRKALEQKTSGLASKVNRVQVIEVEASGGSLDKPNQARVTVERFGGERQSDSMFEKYDENSEKRVRRAFRLPPIFVGQAADYSFATAYVSVTQTEAQVFKPERDEFDEIMSIRVLPAMGYPEYKMLSHGLTVKDPTQQLAGISAAAATNAVEPVDIVEAINDAVGTNLKVSKSALTLEDKLTQAAAATAAKTAPQGGNPSSTPTKPPAKSKPNLKIVKSDGIVALATDMAIAMRKRDFVELEKNIELVKGLTEPEAEEFRSTLAQLQYISPDVDPVGLAELAGCTVAVMSANNPVEHVVKEDGSCSCGKQHA